MIALAESAPSFRYVNNTGILINIFHAGNNGHHGDSYLLGAFKVKSGYPGPGSRPEALAKDGQKADQQAGQEDRAQSRDLQGQADGHEEDRGEKDFGDRLDVVLDKVAKNYDWILIDAAPTLSVLTVAALVAADYALIPVQAETLAHRGVGQLLDTIYDVRKFANSELKIWGVLPTMFDSRTLHARAVIEDIAQTYGLPIIQPAIPRSIRFAEAPAFGATILTMFCSHPGAKAYRQVADEMFKLK